MDGSAGLDRTGLIPRFDKPVSRAERSCFIKAEVADIGLDTSESVEADGNNGAVEAALFGDVDV